MFEIFLIKNVATPLDFQKFFVKNIQKIKNVLRPSSVAVRRQLSPQGEALYFALFKSYNYSALQKRAVQEVRVRAQGVYNSK